MDSARVERLAAAVATMPDGPSRERFEVLLAELTQPEDETETYGGDAGGLAGEHAPADHTDAGWADDLDPGDAIRGGLIDAVPGAAPATALATGPHGAAHGAPDVASDTTAVLDARFVPDPPAALPPTTQQPAAGEPTKKRRWGRKS